MISNLLLVAFFMFGVTCGCVICVCLFGALPVKMRCDRINSNLEGK